MQEPGDILQRARRALDSLSGIESIGEWAWNEDEQKWWLTLKVRHGSPAIDFIPELTHWIVVPDNEFLEGEIEFYPAVTDSIETTFQHQRYNMLDEDRGRRTGRLCLSRPSNALGRMGEDEPSDTTDKFVWRVARLIEWLKDASNGVLVQSGDPFEIPDFFGAAEGVRTFAFQEDANSLLEWQSKPRYGIAHILMSERVGLIERFEHKGEVVHSVSWGELGKRSRRLSKAIWIRIDKVPVTAPWAPPFDFEELKSVVAEQGLKLHEIISNLADVNPAELRNGEPLIVLVGFPIPEKIGGVDRSIHWQVTVIPAVSPKNSKGFRPQSLAIRDEMIVFRLNKMLAWQKSQNWIEANLLTRGMFGEDLRGKRTVIIGAGSLGSAISEQLVRGGFTRILLIDRDEFNAGNATRHVLNLLSVGRNKADALKEHLKLIRPGVQVESCSTKIDALKEEDLKEVLTSSLIIDTTGSNDVLSWAERELKQSKALFVSFSFGYAAKRLFCFAAPSGVFHQEQFSQSVNPWLAYERLTRPADVDLPREGIGCWSVVFPARADDVWLLAATGVKWLENLPKLFKSDMPSFSVFEQKESAAGEFLGVAQAELPATD